MTTTVLGFDGGGLRFGAGAGGRGGVFSFSISRVVAGGVWPAYRVTAGTSMWVGISTCWLMGLLLFGVVGICSGVVSAIDVLVSPFGTALDASLGPSKGMVVGRHRGEESAVMPSMDALCIERARFFGLPSAWNCSTMSKCLLIAFTNFLLSGFNSYVMSDIPRKIASEYFLVIVLLRAMFEIVLLSCPMAYGMKCLWLRAVDALLHEKYVHRGCRLLLSLQKALTKFVCRYCPTCLHQRNGRTLRNVWQDNGGTPSGTAYGQFAFGQRSQLGPLISAMTKAYHICQDRFVDSLQSNQSRIF